MKQEEIKPGDVLYRPSDGTLVKVARVTPDGIVKESAYTDMNRIFKTVPKPYKIGVHPASEYIPATEIQRRYMERSLAVCEYANLPDNNRVQALAYIISDLEMENVELEQRVHQLMDDYNRVARQLCVEGKHEDKPEGTTIGQMREMHELCDKKDSEIEILKEENRQLQQDNKRIYEKLTTAEGVNEDLRKQRDEDLKIIERLNQAEIHTNFSPCPHKVCAGDQSILVGTPPCVNCPYFLRSGSDAILCAFHYDWQNEMQQEKPSDE